MIFHLSFIREHADSLVDSTMTSMTGIYVQLVSFKQNKLSTTTDITELVLEMKIVPVKRFFVIAIF